MIKLVKFQKVREKNSKTTYRGHQIPFGDNETLEANPDQIAVEPTVQSEELIAILSVLDEGGEKVLTKKQRRAFQLVVREGMSTRDAAKRMHCKYQTVQGFVQSAAVKLRKLTLSKRCLEVQDWKDLNIENEGC